MRRARVAVWLLLVAVLCTQASSLNLEYAEHHSADCCILCHIGPFPFLQSPVSTAAAPNPYLAWLEDLGDFNAPREPQLVARSSRAPPVQTLRCAS